VGSVSSAISTVEAAPPRRCASSNAASDAPQQLARHPGHQQAQLRALSHRASRHWMLPVPCCGFCKSYLEPHKISETRTYFVRLMAQRQPIPAGPSGQASPDHMSINVRTHQRDAATLRKFGTHPRPLPEASITMALSECVGIAVYACTNGFAIGKAKQSEPALEKQKMTSASGSDKHSLDSRRFTGANDVCSPVR